MKSHFFCTARENGLDSVVTLIKGRIEDVQLPVERVSDTHTLHTEYICFLSKHILMVLMLQVDIIISEWMVSV